MTSWRVVELAEFNNNESAQCGDVKEKRKKKDKPEAYLAYSILMYFYLNYLKIHWTIYRIFIRHWKLCKKKKK